MRKQFITSLVLCLVVYLPAELLSQREKRPSDFPATFIGTFASVSVIAEDTAFFNGPLTQVASYTYDSVISVKVKYLAPAHTLSSLSTNQLELLTGAVTKNTLEFKRTGDLKKVIPSTTLDSIASMYDNRYTSYFITYGKLWSKKQYQKFIAGRVLIVTALVVGSALLIVLTAPIGGLSGFGDGLFSSSDDGEDFLGMYCYYMVYDKQEKQVCYMRCMRFNSDKTDNNPFNPARVEKQVESLFYLPH